MIRVVRGPRSSAVVAVCLLAAAAACRGRRDVAGAVKTPPPAPKAAPLAFVGRAACARCHADEESRWKGSHHDLAMQEATDETVLGNFDGVRFTHYGVTTTFFKREGKFFARTDGPDGKLHEYPIAYTFGVSPLQQYLIAFPGGRLQALNVVWDTRPAKDGGQRWFHLYPKEEVAHTDPLHWTGPYQNWNFMCADCHSTNVKKGYAEATDSYATTWSELDVSCEACHGPGSAHVAWAEASVSGKPAPDDPQKGLAVVLKDPAKATWNVDPATGIAKRSVPRTSQAEIETCARCHARRSVVAADYVFGEPLMQTYRPALLQEGLYFSDGQIEDEVYEYGSFLQSKMHAAGVSCTDCHDPHSLQVKGSADRVCMACHAADKFDTPKHHFHAAGSPGARCVACHMPTRKYMVVHARHDHSFRTPRPDLDAALGTPDACTGCHTDRSVAWAAAAAQKWWGERARPAAPYAEAIHAGREGRAGASAALARVVEDPAEPAIRRATAATLLGGGPGESGALARALSDPDPLVRYGAVVALRGLDPPARVPLAGPLLRDPVRAVRIEAARALAAAPPDALSPSDRTELERGVAEFIASQEVDADRAEAHASLGTLYAERGDAVKAEAEYRRAIAITPALAAAYANLADLYRAQGREKDSEATLREGLAVSPADAGLHHAIGLSLVRQKRLEEALAELRKAAELAPDRARYAYVYAVALDAAGRTGPALDVLEAAYAKHDGDRELVEALASFSAKAGRAAEAQEYARKLAALEAPAH